MKKLTIIGILLLAVLAYFFVASVKTQDTISDSDETVTKKGEIVEVNLEEMKFDGPGLLTMLNLDGSLTTVAVPSRGLHACLALNTITDVSSASVGDKIEVSGLADPEGRIVPCNDIDHYLRINGFVGDAVYGYEFAYRKGPDGYVVIEDKESEGTKFETGVTLFNKKEYEEFKSSTEPREGPTTMSLHIYRNDEKLDALAWAQDNSLVSNIELAMGEPKASVVGGVDATLYTVDGLYQIDTYIIAHGEYIYLLSGSYSDKESQIYKDFQKLISIFTFTPASAAIPKGKIDPRVACESALAYMTFVSGAEADLFVEACINGKHPEVIERYIKEIF